MDINQTINYKFPYLWSKENMSGPPKVNMLLKALIEKNFSDAALYMSKGATLKAIDASTFERCLFEFVKDYDTINFMVKHGFNGISFKYTHCIDEAGYMWGLGARAFAVNNIKVMELLFVYRFDPGQLWYKGKTYDLPYYAMLFNKIDLIDILLGHGYSPKVMWHTLMGRYRENSKALSYIESNPKVNWKSYGLGSLDKEIPMPEKPKVSFFTTKKTKERLHRKYENDVRRYNDKVAARKQYMQAMPDMVKAYFDDLEETKKLDKMMQPIYDEILKEAQEETLLRIENENRQRAQYSRSSPNNSSIRGYGNQKSEHKSYEEDLRETLIRQFTFVDCSGSYRKWGDSFIDHKGNWCNWGSGFYDYDDNYIRWGSTYKDSSGAYRRWGDNFVDAAGNYVRIP